MKQIVLALLLVALPAAVIGCGGSSDSDKQPKLSGPPDPNVTGPATPGVGGGKDKPAQQAPASN